MKRTPPRRLPAPRHSVWEIDAGLLLVFKPAGHREDVHAHPQGQRLRILRGRLELRTARRVRIVDPASGPVTVRAGQRHETNAATDCWLVAERLGG